MTVLSREELLGKAIGKELHTLPSGGQVRIRPVPRRVQLDCKDVLKEDGLAAAEALMISAGLVEPQLSQADVLAWMDENGADVADLSDAIGVLSGMREGAGKSAVPRPGKR